jgi:hypothetical protein
MPALRSRRQYLKIEQDKPLSLEEQSNFLAAQSS